MSLELRGGNIDISDKDDDFEVVITVYDDGCSACSFINADQAREIIEHLKLQFGI